MRLWIKLAVMIVIAVELQLALPVVCRHFADVCDELDYSVALHWGTFEDQVRVLERVALRCGFHADNESWDANRVRWLAAMRQADQARCAAAGPIFEPPPSPNVTSTGPAEGGDGEENVASAAP